MDEYAVTKNEMEWKWQKNLLQKLRNIKGMKPSWKRIIV